MKIASAQTVWSWHASPVRSSRAKWPPATAPTTCWGCRKWAPPPHRPRPSNLGRGCHWSCGLWRRASEQADSSMHLARLRQLPLVFFHAVRERMAHTRHRPTTGMLPNGSKAEYGGCKSNGSRQSSFF
jgi:hypothetical protein